MSSDQEKIANLLFSAMVLGALSSGLQDFAIQLIARGRKRRLTRDALAEIRQSCIINLKNLDVSGASIEHEAEFLRQAIEQLEKFVDAAIERGWQS